MVRRVAATAALLGALTACTSLQHPKAEPVSPDPTADGSATAEAAPEPRDPAAARAEFRKAIRGFLRTGTGDFTAELSLPDDSFTVRHRGSYVLEGLRSDYGVFIDTPDGSLGMDVRTSGADSWVGPTYLPGTGELDDTCWIHLDREVIEDATNVQVPGGPGLGFPPEVVAVSWAKVAGYDGNGMLAGTTDLQVAASVTGSSLPRSLGIPARSKARVPATFLVAGGVLTGWYVEFADLVQAADDAGYLTPEMRRQLDAAGEDSLDARLAVGFEDLREGWTFRPPPPRQTIEMAADESFDAAMRSCTGIGQGGA